MVVHAGFILFCTQRCLSPAKSRREAVMAAESETEFTQSQQNKTLIFKNSRNQVLGSYKFKTQQVRQSTEERILQKLFFDSCHKPELNTAWRNVF